MGYCERCGKEFNFRHECPDCGCKEEYDTFCILAPKINKNMVECPGCGKKIYEARRHCEHCGALNPYAIKDNGEGYCPDCGISFVDGVCPNCGQKPSDFHYNIPSTANYSYNCSKCGKPHDAIYHFCMDCGNNNRSNHPKRVAVEHKPVVKVYKHGTYCNKCGRKYDSNGYCVYCRNWDKGLKPKINDNMIKCQNCGNEIYEVRRHCDYCGAENPSSDKHNGEGYCPDCGTSFVGGICPDCGKKPSDFRYDISSSAEYYYRCSKCGKKHATVYNFCMDCGNNNNSNRPKSVPLNQEPKDTAIADKYKETKRQTTAYYYDDDEDYPEIKSTLWFILGIVSVVILCMPTGIGTIICSSLASNYEKRGMMDLAVKNIRAAKIWFFAGIGIIVLLMVAAVIIQVSQ